MHIIRYFKNFKNIQKNRRTCRYFCPECSKNGLIDSEYDCHASSRFVWDNLYHKYKFYIKCVCGYTTPAYDTIREAEEHWAKVWAKVEDEQTLKLFNDHSKE